MTTTMTTNTIAIMTPATTPPTFDPSSLGGDVAAVCEGGGGGVNLESNTCVCVCMRGGEGGE